MITPEQLAKPGTEHAIQCAFFCWAATVHDKFPEFRKLLFSVPNGGDRNKVVAARMVAEGAKSGVHDIIFLVPRGNYIALTIEMKIWKKRNTKNGGLSDSQIEFGDAATGAGVCCRAAYSWEQARDILLEYYNS